MQFPFDCVFSEGFACILEVPWDKVSHNLSRQVGYQLGPTVFSRHMKTFINLPEAMRR